MKKKLPWLTFWILKLFCSNDNFNFLSGDLLEAYNYEIQNSGKVKAFIWLWFEIIYSIPGLIKNKIYWGTIMVFNYIKIFFRNFIRYKSYSFINLLGLSLGFTCFALIAYFVTFQFSYDKFHKNKIYRLTTNELAKIPDLWAPELKASFPEVENYARVQWYGETLIERNDKKFYQSGGMFADSTFFEIFSFSLLEGNKKTALKNPNSIVITQEVANKFFADKNPVGETLTFNEKDGKHEYLITGLAENPPSNSHFHFSFLISQSSNKAPWVNSWKWSQFYTYLLLTDNFNKTDLEKKISGWLKEKINEENYNSTVILQPIDEIHLHSNLFRELEVNQDISAIYLFSIIALLILSIAVINFVNLTTTHAVNRAKEVGVRKSVGAERKQLIIQFISESLIFSSFVFLISLLGVYFLIPEINTLFDIKIQNNFYEQKQLIGVLFLIAMSTGLIGSIYPSLILSRFRPMVVLKGISKLSDKSKLRKGMVIFQFAISAFLIISSLVIYNQMDYISKKNLGFNKDHVVTFRIRSDNMRNNYEAFKNELLSNRNISNVSFSANLPGGSDWGMPYKAEGINDKDLPDLRMLVGDYDFINTYGLEISKGRKFNENFSTDTSAYILNETAVKVLGWETPFNKSIAIPVSNREWGNIVGVVKDFHFRSLHEKIAPIVLFIPPQSWYSKVSVKLKPHDLSNTLSFIEDKWTKFDQTHPFTFTFLDKSFGSLYLSDKRNMELISYSTLIAIFIACLGLYALISFTLVQKTKEIGIRKVLGAKVFDIVYLVSKEFMGLLLMANIIAWPATFYFLQDWLDGFAYRIDISLVIFVVGSLSGLLIAVSVISYKVVKAALTNPLNSIRIE